jgi:RNA polymerase sigma factor (sigma-70 family)
MNTVSRGPSQAETDAPHFIFHPSFEEPDAEAVHGAAPVHDDDSRGYMPDDMTRDFAKHMHYAAWRAFEATTRRGEATFWRRRYYPGRNSIVVGNRKLIYKAVQKWMSSGLPTDDLVGECHLVLIKAVAAYNPWLGIRFSTYAFTCLMRALSRLSQRHSADRLSGSRLLESLASSEPSGLDSEEPTDPRLASLREFFREDASLLTSREKLVLSRRYQLNGMDPGTDTLEQVGRDLRLSKERVRQVQKAALLKLREALTSVVPVS